MSAVAPSPKTAPTSPELAAARLYREHRQAIYRLCLAQLRQPEDAADAVQTTFVYALRSLRRGVVPRFELPWLWKIACNVCSTQRRSIARRAHHESDSDVETLEDTIAGPTRVDAPLTARELRAGLRTLPLTQRHAILLREWKGLSYEEIGNELGISQAATETVLYRARRSLAGKLDELRPAFALDCLSLSSFARSLIGSTAAKGAAVIGGSAITITAASVAVHEAFAPPHVTARLRPTPVAIHASPGVDVYRHVQPNGVAKQQLLVRPSSGSRSTGPRPAPTLTTSAPPPPTPTERTSPAAPPKASAPQPLPNAASPVAPLPAPLAASVPLPAPSVTVPALPAVNAPSTPTLPSAHIATIPTP